MTKYLVTKKIQLTWEIGANSAKEAEAIADDMGEHTAKISTTVSVRLANAENRFGDTLQSKL